MEEMRHQFRSRTDRLGKSFYTFMTPDHVEKIHEMARLKNGMRAADPDDERNHRVVDADDLWIEALGLMGEAHFGSILGVETVANDEFCGPDWDYITEHPLKIEVKMNKFGPRVIVKPRTENPTWDVIVFGCGSPEDAHWVHWRGWLDRPAWLRRRQRSEKHWLIDPSDLWEMDALIREVT